ncbi:DUF1631 family protein [Parahaliea mediterranea]|uniref:DUF1631 family protein n=1 Tax=Parahaliea mediterranea TaxID=651086 RepID=A0A939DIQ2_9GAMM|nr:DUF1631 family protein [Parahaliea mediterranea]MBN7798262.1 DUF1631 family protein [Parahaliea mediterranea]
MRSLQARKFFELEPAAAVMALDEAVGNWPAMSARQTALLKWLLQSLAYWEVGYPLAVELRDHVRSLLPQLARRALEDDAFTRPGLHPAHRVLDTLQADAVGWQPGMGRAGDTLLGNLQSAIESLREALEHGDDSALDALAAGLEKSAIAEERRNLRMVQRLAEKARGHQKTAAARARAAQMINTVLSRHSLPAQVGHFIRGPWYDSVRLVLLKFGEQSPQWRQVSTITDELAHSLQPDAVSPEEDEQRALWLARIKRLPGELRDYLLSLQHDEEAVSEAVGLIEFSHLRLLRQQPLQLYPVEPLPVEGPADQDRSIPGTIARLDTGQWFLVQGDGERGAARVQLALKQDESQELLFANRAGMKAFSLGYAEFDAALSRKTARELQRGGSFSLCLMRAAGITTVEQLRALAEPPPRSDSGGTAPTSATPDAAPPPERHARASATDALRDPLDGDPGLPPEQDFAAGDNPPEPEPLGLATGTWMGFHDCDPPMLARLAAHDRERGMYIFVNRQGLKLRQLSNADLLALAERNLVDIFEARSSFNDHVRRLKSDTPG